MKHRTVEGVMFIIAFIKEISGYLRPTFCTPRAGVSFAPALKASRMRPPAYLDWTLFLSDLWDTSSSEFTGEVYNLTAPAAYQVPCCNPHSRVGRRGLEFMIWWGWNCPWRYCSVPVQHEISNLWQRGRQAAGGSSIWYCSSKTHQKTLVRTIKLLSTALAFYRDLKASASYIYNPFTLFFTMSECYKWEQGTVLLMLVQ